jgi:ATP-dependent DNA ligase
MTGFRILAHRQGQTVRLRSRNGHDLAGRVPQIVEAMRSLPVQSYVINGEAIVANDKRLAVFDLIREHRHHVGAELCAFDMLELDGEDLRRTRIEERKRTLARLLGRFQPGIVVNEYFEGDGRSSTGKPARSAARASCRNGWGRHIVPADHSSGSKSRTRMRRPCGDSKKKIGTDDTHSSRDTYAN